MECKCLDTDRYQITEATIWNYKYTWCRNCGALHKYHWDMEGIGEIRKPGSTEWVPFNRQKEPL